MNGTHRNAISKHPVGVKCGIPVASMQDAWTAVSSALGMMKMCIQGRMEMDISRIVTACRVGHLFFCKLFY
jgi:hypothetical protein